MFIKLALVIIGSATLAASQAILSFEKSSLTVEEYKGEIEITLKASGLFIRQFSVTVVCSAGSATSDDFDTSPITVTFAPRRRTQKFTLPIVDDKECEGEETLVCEVMASSFNRFRRPGRVRSVNITIIDSSEDEVDCDPVPGVTYVRWGNSSCPDVNGTSRVYEGRASSGSHDYNGGASDFVCLISQGEYHPTSTTTDSGLAYMFGTKYRIEPNQALTHDRDYQNVSCAVCEVDNRSKHLMIPGTYKCPSGWTEEYFGWLMTGDCTHSGASTFVCVDFGAEVVPGEAQTNDGALLHHVQVACAYGMQCPPYDRRKEVSCVVCTK